MRVCTSCFGVAETLACPRPSSVTALPCHLPPRGKASARPGGRALQGGTHGKERARRTGVVRTTSWLPPRGKLAPVRTLVTDEGLYFLLRRCGNSNLTPTLIRHGFAVTPSPVGEGKGRDAGRALCAGRNDLSFRTSVRTGFAMTDFQCAASLEQLLFGQCFPFGRRHVKNHTRNIP